MAIISQNSSNNKTPPTINISPSTPQEKLDSLLKQESEFMFTTPAASPTFPKTTGNGDELKCPSPVHASTITTQHEDVPPYEHTAIDMPPSYQATFKPSEEQWPITKKLFFIGFFFWPLWFVGMGFSVFGRSATTRKWGRWCGWNSLAVTVVFTYLVVAYIRTGGALNNNSNNN